jgi:hypothetical protein
MATLNDNITTVKAEIQRHLDALTAKPTRAEAKAWSVKHDKLHKQLNDLLASDPNRKVRIKDDDEQDDDNE